MSPNCSALDNRPCTLTGNWKGTAAPVLTGDAAQDAYFSAVGTATGIVVTFTPPTGASGISGAGVDWSCSGSATLTCRYAPHLAPGASASFGVALSAPSAPGIVEAAAGVSGDQFDAGGANNSAFQSAQVAAAPPPPPPPPSLLREGESGGLSLAGLLGMAMAWLARRTRDSHHRRSTARPSP